MNRDLNLNVISLQIDTKQNGFVVDFIHPDNCCELVASSIDELFEMLREIFSDPEWEKKYKSVRFTFDTDERYLKNK